MTIGIISAMAEELAGLMPLLTKASAVEAGMRSYHIGELCGVPAVLTLSRIGKAAAASTVTTLIDRFKAESILFSGLAGGIPEEVNIGDVVVADRLIQHDMDASAVMDFQKFEVPLLNKIFFESDKRMLMAAEESAKAFIKQHPDFQNARLHRGIIASGDRFIHKPEESQIIHSEIPGVLAVEMEGAAAAQICYEWNVPFCAIRCISDKADGKAPTDFLSFLKRYAAPLSAGIVLEFMKKVKL